MGLRISTSIIFTAVLLSCCHSSKNESSHAVSMTPEQLRDPQNAGKSFTTYDGVGVQQFASEPMLINPTNLDIDERGRIWVCEAQNYRGFRNDHPQREAGDRILILEDTNGDGSADDQRVFYQGTDVNSALGIAKLGTKVYIAASPHMLVFTDADGDDIPEQKDTLFTGLDGVDHDHGVHAIVFGPDGKLYFNYGNEGKRLRLKSGELAKDKRGNTIEEGQVFRQGMIFRCGSDGTDLEILGHNFRNNYELAVDPFGAIWQSDNDDDGNKGTRINFVMDYGNYGFKDQITGAGWRTPRIGMHEEIPKRHWHLNDPGVVPNLLQTGAGSPTGILVYEGEMMPKVFHGQMIHCEPGKNVVRSYPVNESGAGYRAAIIPLLSSTDAWFRPSDVCVAPDGSIFVADWYDAGVGGHLMADIERGRIYRLYAKGQEKYQFIPPQLEHAEEAVHHLNHANQSVRYLAFQKVRSAENAQDLLEQLIQESDDDRLRAHAFWCLASIPEAGPSSIQLAQSESNPNLRMLALRMGRQYLSARELLSLIEQLAVDHHPGVLREAALSLRFLGGTQADKLWTDLATKYDGKDRWYLEALGIGSDLFADARFEHYLSTMNHRDLKASADIIWRMRSDKAIPHLYELVKASKTAEEMVRYFRAMHFLSPDKTAPYLARALHEKDHPKKNEMIRFALASLSPRVLQEKPEIQKRVKQVLPNLRGTDTWTMVARNAKIKSEAPILLDSALVSSQQNFRKEAINLVAEIGGLALIQKRFTQANLEGRLSLMDLATHLQGEAARDWKLRLFWDQKQPDILRHRAAKALANDWSGMSLLMDHLEADSLAEKDAEVVSTYLSQAWRNDIRQRAIAWITENKGNAPINLDDLANQIGNAEQGSIVFDQYCQGCHQVQGRGQNFGPDLSEIGDKLGKDGLLSAIVYPSLGIGFGYEGFEIRTNDGKVYSGFIESQTEDEITLRMMGGLTQTIPVTSIAARNPLSESLMTANLHQLMTEEELINLIEFLAQLKARAPT